MKRKMVSLLLALVGLVCMSSCSLTDKVNEWVKDLIGPSNGIVVGYDLETTETRVVIIPKEKVGELNLIDYMETIRMNGGFTFEMENGMVTSVNGKANAADFSSCWMLYTSDAEFSNAEWGTIEYEGKALGSAVVGAESLPVETDEVYIWEYVTF